MRLACFPAAIQADISSAGDPSLVTSPLNNFIATCVSALCEDAEGEVHVPREIIPEAPSPRTSETWSSDHAISSKTGFSFAYAAHGLPANARKDSSGIANNHSGRVCISLALIRSKPSFVHDFISDGSVFSLFPASMHFCRRGHEPIEEGREVMALLVRISQRRLGGRWFSGIVVMPFDLKATISRAGHCERLGKAVKAQFERKRILRWEKDDIEVGRWLR